MDSSPADPPSPTPTDPSPSPRRSFLRRHRVITAVGSLVLVGVLVAAGTIAWVQLSQRGRIRTQADVPAEPVALVFGAGIWSNGHPSLYLARRLEIARSLYEEGRVKAILVSGDNSRKDYDEATTMRDWLLERGVPEDKVVRDFAGFDTYDSCVRAHDIFGVDAAIVVSQDYHVPRALFLCRAAGLDAYGIGASAAGGSEGVYTLREGPASLKAAWDALTHRDPVFRGPKETGIADALREG